MPREKETLLLIAAKASTLFERLHEKVVDLASPTLKTEAMERRLARWRQAVTGAEDGAAGFEARLKLSGLDLKKSAPYLGEVMWRSGKKLPKWISIFEEILKIKDLKSAARVFQKKNPIPFEELVSPFVVYAERRVAPLKKKLAPHVSDSVWVEFERTLLCRLSALAAKPFFETFQKQLHPAGSLSLFQDFLKPNQKKSGEKYERFVREFLESGGLSFYAEYAVLVRLLVTVTEQWVAQTTKFFERLEKDRRQIEQTFHAGKSVGPLTDVKLGLSDPHHEGATVVSMGFAGGLKLIYKPKNLKTEIGFLNVLSWLNQNGAPFPFKVLKVLNQHQYGWIEFAASSPCRNEDQLRRYYTKMGMLLGVVYFLDGTDCHAENIMACGEEPVLIDMESVLQHSAQNAKSGEAERVLDRSVLRTGILPTWIAAKEGKCYDVSPLAPSASQPTGFRYAVWKKINTDQMHLEKEETILNLAQNSPALKNKKISVERYQSQVIAGFESIYRLIMAKRREFVAAKGPLCNLNGCQTRFIYRPTNVYAQLALRLLDEPYLKEGVDRSIEIEALTRNLSQEPLLAAYEAERNALERCDIPCFYGQTNEIGLYCDEKKVTPHFFQQPSFERVCEKLAQGGDDDLQRQIRLIKGAFYARFSDPLKKKKRSAKKEQKVSFVASWEEKDYLFAAEKIAQQILSEAILDRNGRLAWVGLGFSPVTQKMQIQAISENVYDGRVGVALFFAALYSLTQKKEYRQKALATLSSLRENMKQASVREALARRVGLGICAGLGGLIYGFARISAFLKEDSLLKEAGLLVDAITPKLIEEDTALDVELGSAGAILALLFLAKSPQHRKKALAKALQCGEHLLQARRRSDSGHAVWFLPGIERPLTGFSHGAAGFAYALLQLYHATKQKSFLAAAKEGLAYEASLFSKTEKNWPDLRQATKKYLNNWCHGAAGIGLARLGTATFFSNAQIQKDIQNSVDSVLKADLNGYDHLCCGTAGRIDTLIEASLKFKKPDLLLEAKKRAGGLLRRAEQRKRYSLIVSADGDFQSISLFQGLAGIGYQCLRVIAPKQIPSILLFQ